MEDRHMVGVFIGVDVGKSNHHALALTRNGKKLMDKTVAWDEAKLPAIIEKLARRPRDPIFGRGGPPPSARCR
ncbi:transposase [Paenarthrobacter sp. PH39-S1]|uniref:IS110 family transposase n=1 Tax=Paenarthrobacter sp. PH39-S1 TaxID=3046204 RepID=UPI0024BB7F8D|nr:transposase [Paenarthrobacter sp. PH39-S1]MDJ0357383.1 transposase [Paenarthrobacter sp. PH39-S1]